MRLLSSWKTLLVCILVAACARGPEDDDFSVNSSGQIFGGEKVAFSEAIARSTVGIYNRKQKTYCTGTLLAKNIVLTAGHCLTSADRDHEIRFGLKLERASRRVLKALREPHYTKDPIFGPANDVALVKFEGRVPEGYVPAKLIENFSSLRVNAPVLIAGYGMAYPRLRTGLGTLRKTTLPLSKPDYKPNEFKILQEGKTGTCFGDSGGPVYAMERGEFKLIGVTSKVARKENGHRCLGSSIYSRVDFYQAWINSALEALNK
ncbi:trypsin-like serine protease [Bdellovibrio sp. 22V]|uniref:S1 family peptidase n=1 Tax=Bdellovibrio sp. 22V TaxID=3044166 RepID=UPI002543339E|nr:trypsin-like serine protease [Bdellovibrio sp. 22V]WII71768.1 trypsin-like serine protease [Bdellovibrio sp. 22V]